MEKPEEITFAWLLLMGITITFVLGLAVVLFVLFYQRRLHGQRMEVEHMKGVRKREQLEAALNAQEHERERIAKDLHDEVGATLSTAKLLLSHYNSEENELLEKVQSLVSRSILNLRNISHNLIPPSLKDFGLEKTLNSQMDTLDNSGAIAAQFSSNLSERLPENTELQVYRIAQELVNNTLKHAQASALSLTLKEDKNRIRLLYTDNGTGLHTKGEKTDGLGLKNLKNRAETLQGEWALNSDKGQGMSFSLHFPIASSPSTNIED